MTKVYRKDNGHAIGSNIPVTRSILCAKHIQLTHVARIRMRKNPTNNWVIYYYVPYQIHSSDSLHACMHGLNLTRT